MSCIVPNITLSLIYQIKKGMKSKLVFTRLTIFTLILLVATGLSDAQSKQNTAANPSLYDEIAQMDSVLFNAFNTRDIDLFKNFFAEDLEFYHDTGGLTNYEHTVNFLKTTAETGNQLKRQLVKGSLEVYPIPGYGAMEIGSHTFCHLEGNKEECGTFKFVQVWQKKHDQWRITRVISYGH